MTSGRIICRPALCFTGKHSPLFKLARVLVRLDHGCSRVFIQLSVNVQANVIQPRNGQSQSEREQPKRRARFTGERLKLLRPETYRQAVELLAEPREQVPYDHICRLLHVCEHTLKAIEKAELLSIAEQKERLLHKALRIASKAADRVEDQIDGANITQTTVAFGVATEKMMLLLGETGGVPVQVNMQVKAQLLHERYAELIASLPQPPSAMELQSGKESQKTEWTFHGRFLRPEDSLLQSRAILSNVARKLMTGVT
jgi:hypothetical protein